MAPTLVFVYGTLKRGGSNHGFLDGQEFLQEARTAPHYRLYSCGSYPGLVEEVARGVAVQGEIWRVDAVALAALDELEEVPVIFARRAIVLEASPAQVVAYFYLGDVSGRSDCGDCWHVMRRS